MGCDETQSRLSAWVDGLLDEPESTAVREHLEGCDGCRSREQDLVAVHAELTQALAPDRMRAHVLADHVLNQLSTPADDEPSRRLANHSTVSGESGRLPMWRRAIGYLLSAAAGFLIATVFFCWPGTSGVQNASVPIIHPAIDSQNQAGLETAGRSAAHFVHATGNVAFRPTTNEVWTSITPVSIATFACPSEGSVRTESGSLCELKTSTGNLVRMNESSEIRVLSDDELELVQGQIWCRASHDSPLKVVTAERGGTELSSAGQLLFTCPSNSEGFASCTPAQPVQVAAASGTVDVRMDGTEHNLQPGTFCTIADGDVTIRQSTSDLLIAERWMQPLLTLSGHGNPELSRRVDALLAHIGRTKLSQLYEHDLRSLGEYGALPLLKFVTSEESSTEPSRRRFAMSIIADTAPVWMVPDLIGLLEDMDPDVRRHAARGLTRLTGETQGLLPEDWHAGADPPVEGVASWRSWWEQHRSSFPLPPATTSANLL